MSRQGELFKQIKELPFGEIPWGIFVNYAGYKRGIETFIKIVYRENEVLRNVVIPDPNQPWGSEPEYANSSLEGLMYVIGQMNTARSFEVLMTFAKGDFHPYIHCEAVWGLSHDSGHDHEIFNLAKELLRSPRHTLDIYSGLLVIDHWKYKLRAEAVICEAGPFLDHDYFMARLMAGSALTYTKAGRDYLLEYKSRLRERGMTEIDKSFVARLEEMIVREEPHESMGPAEQ